MLPLSATRNGNSCYDGRDNVSLPQGTGAAGDQGEQEALEETGRLVQCLPQRIVGVDVELLRLVNLVSDTVKKHRRDEFLCNGRFRRDEKPGSRVNSIRGP